MSAVFSGIIVFAALLPSGILFMDDFNDGNDDGWTHSGSAVFQVIDGVYHIHSEGSKGAGFAWTGEQSGQMSVADYRVFARINIDSGTSAGIAARYCGEDDWFYRLVMKPGDDIICIERKFGSAQSFTLDTHPFDLEYDTDYHAVLQVSGSSVSGKVWTGNPDDEPQEWLLQAEDGLQWNPGSVAVFAAGYGKVSWSVSYDDVGAGTLDTQSLEQVTWAGIKSALY